MKKIIPILILVLLTFGLTACGNADGTGAAVNNSAAAPESSQVVTEEESGNISESTEAKISDASGSVSDNKNESQPSENLEKTGADVLVVYFSATGTTKGVAEKLAGVTGADIYEIVPTEPYTEADLNWHDSDSRTTHEQDDKSVRPGISGDKLSLDGYTTVYIGYPIWWGEEPRIMDTFVESYDFSGKTMIPFCTSGGSGIGSSGDNLRDNAGNGNWVEGARLNADISESELQDWVNGLK